MKTNILYIERKFWEFVSIEKVFRQIAENLSYEKYQYSFKQMPFGNGFAEILKNLIFFRKSSADVYHITGHIHYISLVLPRKKTILTIHDLGFLHTRNGLRRYLIKKLFLDLPVKKLKYITAISETTKQEIIEQTKCAEDKIRLIENPLRDFKNQNKIGFNKDCPTILQIGTSPNKNLAYLIKAIEGISCNLRIIGKLNENLLSKLKISNIKYSNVFDLGDDEIEEEYRTADIVSFCSTYEGFGLPIIEAQAMKTPVITSNLSPMREVAGGAAVLVNPKQPESIREGILKLIEKDDFREDLIIKGIENVKRYDPIKIVNQYENLYRELIENKNG
ncbi:MAG TPA: glycosyltransferase family 1 protein [Pyrinomonadaceae bacterium]|nr:glycosyltransferase family 1 protein [Pyrinomonadaceae bacterium]